MGRGAKVAWYNSFVNEKVAWINSFFHDKVAMVNSFLQKESGAWGQCKVAQACNE